MSAILTDIDARGIATLTLNRPEVHNAFNTEMMLTLTQHIQTWSADDAVRVVLLRGAGKSFCAGADLAEMKASKTATHAENQASAQTLSAMFTAINHCSKPVISIIHSTAMGGGCGLASVSDVVIASSDALFGLTEVKLGLIPAVISPYVLAKIGASHARDLFLSGRRFSAAHAQHIGLVHRVVATDQLSIECDAVVAEFLSAAPGAIASAKHLIATLHSENPNLAELIATLRTGHEAQEGLDAFLNKRKPQWCAS